MFSRLGKGRVREEWNKSSHQCLWEVPLCPVPRPTLGDDPQRVWGSESKANQWLASQVGKLPEVLCTPQGVHRDVCVPRKAGLRQPPHSFPGPTKVLQNSTECLPHLPRVTQMWCWQPADRKTPCSQGKEISPAMIWIDWTEQRTSQQIPVWRSKKDKNKTWPTLNWRPAWDGGVGNRLDPTTTLDALIA